MQTDIAISNQAELKPIAEIAAKLNLSADDIEPYGKYKAKISRQTLQKLPPAKGNLILVTAITPTKAGEGKSTVSIGLADALNKLGKKAVLSLREPSLGPCFGIKGGATGGGMSQIVPMDEINLNFTGDIHAITAANNLLCAMIDNHITHGNELNIRNIFFKRCLDLNDRALREIRIGMSSSANGKQRTENFNISVASEIMAILCLSENMADLKKRLANIIIAENTAGKPIYAKDLRATGAMAAILKDALLPNLVQTLEHTPAFVHGGPFANIAHGTSSVIAARTALSLADYVVTEAGFGADLGAEKFFDIFARQSNIFPQAVVLVATVRALKMHGNIEYTQLYLEDLSALEKGFVNLEAHVKNLKKFGYTPVVAINRFKTDTPNELALLQKLCKKIHVKAIISEGWEKGGNGCVKLAEAVLKNMQENPATPKLLYSDDTLLPAKIQTLAKEIYNARKAVLNAPAKRTLAKFDNWGYARLPICMAKTQNSISHNKDMLGAPQEYDFPVSELRLAAGAGFIVALSGKISTMPGLPKIPAAEQIDVDNEGNITGLF